MELMKSLVPRLARIGIFHDSRTGAARFAGRFEQAAKSLGLEAVMVPALTGGELVQAMRAIPARRIQAGVMAWLPPDSGESFLREAAAMRLPLLGVNDMDEEQGALMAYSSMDAAFAARMAAVVEQVLRGVDPATLPFQLPQTFRLVVNKRAATTLGLAVPAELLLRAERVIE
jgi:putative ABC transport system substrate-binding protein